MSDRRGEQWGDYHLLDLLGVGTFGEVYAGEHLYLKTRVAIKILQAHIDQTEFQHFVEEARTIAALEHPHIVRILSFSLQQRAPYLVMQLAQSSLKERLVPGQPQPAEALLPYLQQAVEGLQYAHDQRVMHLDIKPANLLLTAQDEVLLADFGLARALQTQRTHQTMPGFAGTPAYAAPEQFQNKPGLASDQYALGVLVYQWLTGALPFDGDWWAIGHQKLTKTPPPLRARVPTLAPAIEAVALRALAPDPKDRFPTVRAFAHAFEQALSRAEPKTSPAAPQPRRSLPSISPTEGGSARNRPAVPFSPMSLPPLSPTPEPEHLQSPTSHPSQVTWEEPSSRRRKETWEGEPIRAARSRPPSDYRQPPSSAFPGIDTLPRQPHRWKRMGWHGFRPRRLLLVLAVCVVLFTAVAVVPGVRSILFSSSPPGRNTATQTSVNQGTLTLQVNTPSATVTLDSTSYTTTAEQTAPFSRISIPHLAAGTHPIAIHAANFADFIGQVQMPATSITMTAWLAPSADRLSALASQFQPATQPDPGVAGDHYNPTNVAADTLSISISYLLGGLNPSPFTSQLVPGGDTKTVPFNPAPLTLTPDITFMNAAGTKLYEYKPQALPTSQFALQMPLTFDAQGAPQLGTPTVTLPANVSVHLAGPAQSDYALYYALAAVLPATTSALSFTCAGAVDTQRFNPEDGLALAEAGGARYFYRWGLLWATNATAASLTPKVPRAVPGSNEFNDANTARVNGSCGGTS